MRPVVFPIASPGRLSDRWADVIEKTHIETFGWSMDRYTMNLHWWFAGLINKDISGIAGASREDDRTISLGPCIVLPQFRGHGHQRDFVRARERMAVEQGLSAAVARTLDTNYASVNNLLALGYQLVPPWGSRMNRMHLHWRKRLCPNQRSLRLA